MKLREFFLGAVALIVMVSCGGKQTGAPTEAPPQKYPTIVVSKQDAVLESVYPATIKGREDIEIRPHVDGFIKAIYVDEGSVVKKGQELFLIDSPQSDQAVTTAQAAVVSAEAQLKTAALNVERMRPLAEKEIVSPVQLKTVENTYETAKAALDQAKASLTNALATKAWTRVTSPVDGVVGTITYRIGSLVSSAYVLTTVANTNSVFAYFSMNEKALMMLLNSLEGNTQAEKIKNMSKVTLTLADGSVYPEKGTVETITGVINVNTGSANIRAEFPNKQGMLRSGASGKIAIPETLNGVFVIPQKATFAQQDKILVYKVQADTTVQSVISAIGMPDGKSYAVTGGLNEGDRIISDNIATVRNNMKIKVD